MALPSKAIMLVWSRMQDSNPRSLFTRQVLCLLS
jgi:hypothetical protein